MMRERNNSSEPSDLAAINMTFEVYLKHRESPVNVNATFEIRKEVLKDGSELESLMQVAANHILSTIDVVAEHRLIFSDERFNKMFFMTDEIQAVSILAPDEETILKALEE